ncbi:SPY [Symbiodinium pilosum]|uniref:SPY protein n=1 Tax=Symbiodinium pilosum TaxID=2952 RepID=A0A812Q4L2_SYMPI|nr:SPY [Symbiodinium pilosum]
MACREVVGLDSTQPFSEELVRIPGCFLCYTPPSRVPDVEALPALRNGYITFGSFSCLAKVGDPVVALWARCLHEVPSSKLLVKNKGFYSQDVQATFINKFKAYGIQEHRLKLMALAPTSFEHLNIYNEVSQGLAALLFGAFQGWCLFRKFVALILLETDQI